MAVNVSVYSTFLLSTLWLIGLDINLFLLVLVPFAGVNAACITSSFPSSADYGAPSPTDSIYTSVSLPDYGEVNVLRIGDSRQHIPRVAVPSSSVDDSSTPTFHLPAIVMTPFSILPIIGYTILALLLTYLCLRLLRRFNIRLLPTFLSSNKDRIPQPVTSASGKNWGFGKGWSWSLNVFRRSFKGPNATTPTKSRHRPTDLDLQGVELLPTSSRAKDGQLIDISSSTTASTITGVKLGVYADSSNVGSADAEQFQHLQKDIGEGRHLSRSSSVDAFPQFSSSNPFAVFDTPVKSHTVPSTPPLTNTSSNSTYPSPFTPPSVSSFHLHSPSPFIPHVAAASKSTLNPFKFSVLGSSRPPSPSLSLSTSPLSKHRRSKSLGGVPLKRLGGSIKGKEKQRDEILVDYSSSGSSSQESASDPPPSSLTSSDVGTQRILPEPIAISHSRSEGSYLYGPLVPLPVPLVDVDMPEPMPLGPTGTSHIWAFDVDVEDQRADFIGGKLVDVSDNESNNGADREDGRLLDVDKVDHTERLVDVSEDERDDIPLVSVQKSLIEHEKLVDIESATPVHISPVHSPPRSPTRAEPEEPKLIDVSDYEDVDVEAQQEEQESWNWDDDSELDPWAQPANNFELIPWDEKHAEEKTTMAQAINIASASTTKVTEQEAVTEPATDLPSEQSSDGLDDVQAVAAVPVEETAETSVDISIDVSAAQATVSIAEKPPVLVVSDEAPASSAAGELSVSSPELPCFKITLESPGSPDAEIGVCLVPPTPMIHPVEDLDEDYIPQDVLEKLNVLQSRAPSPSESDEDDTPLTKTNDIHDHNDTPIAAPILELPPLSIPLITISSEVHRPEESEGVPDPDLLPLPEFPSVPLTDAQPSYEKEESPKEPLSQTPTPPASPPMSVVRSIPSSPRKEKDSSRPAWSLRAADAPALGLASAQSSPSMKPKSLLPETKEMTISSPIEPSPAAIVPTLTVTDLSTSLPGAFPGSVAISSTVPEPTAETSADLKVISSDASVKVSAKAVSTAVAAQPGLRRRMPRSPIDIALAMQLRPGLGVGADPAWMVRFLMTMFGWFAVLISGGGEF